MQMIINFCIMFWHNVVSSWTDKSSLEYTLLFTNAEDACDDASKRILKPSTYRFQIFLVRDQYLRSLLPHRDQAIAVQLEKRVPSLCLRSLRLKPGLRIVGRIVSMCLRPCPKEHITALLVSTAKISCEILLLSKTYVSMWKNCVLITSITLTERESGRWIVV